MTSSGIREAIAQAISVLRRGGVVAFPTDTFYGLGADIFDPQAVAKVYQAKGRSQEQGLPVLLASIQDMEVAARDIPDLALTFARAFWPGPLTLVLRKSPKVPGLVSGGDTVAVRVPHHDIPTTLARELGAPLTGTSANRSGGPSPVTAEDVRRQLGDSVDLIIDGGACPGGAASTIIDLTVDRPTVLRRGSLSLESLQKLSPAPIQVAEVAR